jgi:hypothetical protein
LARSSAEAAGGCGQEGGKKCSTFTFVKDKKKHTRIIRKYKNGKEYVIYNNKKLGLETLRRYL